MAVCEVDPPFELDPDTAWPVCLPKPDDKLPKEGETCEMVAWGPTGDKAVKQERGDGHKVKLFKPDPPDLILFENWVCPVSMPPAS